MIKLCKYRFCRDKTFFRVATKMILVAAPTNDTHHPLSRSGQDRKHALKREISAPAMLADFASGMAGLGGE